MKTGLTSMPLTLIDFGWLPSLLMNLLFCFLSFMCSLLLLHSVTLIENNQNFNERFEYSATVRHYLAPLHGGAPSLKRFHPLCSAVFSQYSAGSEGTNGARQDTVASLSRGDDSASPSPSAGFSYPYGPAPLLRRFLCMVSLRNAAQQPAASVCTPQNTQTGGEALAGAAEAKRGEREQRRTEDTGKTRACSAASPSVSCVAAPSTWCVPSASSVFLFVASLCNLRKGWSLAVGVATSLYSQVVRGVHSVITRAPPLLPPSFPRTFTMLLHLNTFLSTCSAALLVAYCIDCLFLTGFSFTLFLPLLPTDINPFQSVCGALEWLGSLSALLLRPLLVLFDVVVSFLLAVVSLGHGPLSLLAPWVPSWVSLDGDFASVSGGLLGEAQTGLEGLWMSLSVLVAAITNSLSLPLAYVPAGVSSAVSQFLASLPEAFVAGYTKGSGTQPYAVPSLPFLYALPSQRQIEEVFSGVCTPNCDGAPAPASSSLLPAVVKAFFLPGGNQMAESHSEATLSDLAAAAAGQSLGTEASVCTPCVGHMGITLGYAVTAGICLHLAAADLQDNMQLQFLSFGAIVAAVFQITGSAALVLLRLSSASSFSSLFAFTASSPLSAPLSADGASPVPTPSEGLLGPEGTCAAIPQMPGLRTSGPAAERMVSGAPRLPSAATLAHEPGKASGVLSSPWPSAVVRGSGIGSLVSTFVDAYSFSNALPTWANEIKDDVPVTRTILTSTAFSCAVYFLFGFLCAAAFPAPSASSNVLAAMLPSCTSFVAVACICFFHVFALLPNIVTGQISCRYDLINMAICMDKQSAFFTASKLPWLLYWLLTFSPVFALPSSLLTLSTNVLLNFAAPAVVFIYALHACADGGDFPDAEDLDAKLLADSELSSSLLLSKAEREGGSDFSGETDAHGLSPSPDWASESAPRAGRGSFLSLSPETRAGFSADSPTLSTPVHPSRLVGDSLSTAGSIASVSSPGSRLAVDASGCAGASGLKSCLKPAVAGLRSQGRKKTVITRIDAGAFAGHSAGDEDGLHRLRMEAAEAGSRRGSGGPHPEGSGAMGAFGGASDGGSPSALKRAQTQDVLRSAKASGIGSSSLELHRGGPSHGNAQGGGASGNAGMARVSGAVAGGGCARSREVQRQLHEWLQEYSRQLPDSEVAQLLQRQQQEEEDERRRLKEEEDERRRLKEDEDEQETRRKQLGNAWLRRQALGEMSPSEDEKEHVGEKEETDEEGGKNAEVNKEANETAKDGKGEDARTEVDDGNVDLSKNQDTADVSLEPEADAQTHRGEGAKAEAEATTSVPVSSSISTAHASVSGVTVKASDQQGSAAGDAEESAAGDAEGSAGETGTQEAGSGLLGDSTDDGTRDRNGGHPATGDTPEETKREKETSEGEAVTPVPLGPGEIPVEFAAASAASRFVRRQVRTRRVDAASAALEARQRVKREEQQRAATRDREAPLGGEAAGEDKDVSGEDEGTQGEAAVSREATVVEFSESASSQSLLPGESVSVSPISRTLSPSAPEASLTGPLPSGVSQSPAALAPGEIPVEFAPATAASAFVRRTAKSARIDSVAVALQKKRAERQRKQEMERQERETQVAVGEAKREADPTDSCATEMEDEHTNGPASPSPPSASPSSRPSSLPLSLSADSPRVETPEPFYGACSEERNKALGSETGSPFSVGSLSGQRSFETVVGAGSRVFSWQFLRRAAESFKGVRLASVFTPRPREGRQFGDTPSRRFWSLWSRSGSEESGDGRSPAGLSCQSLVRQCTSRLTLQIPGALRFAQETNSRRGSTSTYASASQAGEETGPRVVVFSWLPTVEQKLVATYVLLLVICFCAVAALAEDMHAFLEALVAHASRATVWLLRLFLGGVWGTASRGAHALVGLLAGVVPGAVSARAADLVAWLLACVSSLGDAVGLLPIPSLDGPAGFALGLVSLAAKSPRAARLLGPLWRLWGAPSAAGVSEGSAADPSMPCASAANDGATAFLPNATDLETGDEEGLWSFEAFFLSLISLLVTAVPLFVYVSPARQRERRRKRLMQRRVSADRPGVRRLDPAW
ncbi:conserved hypothetical protein [Neospora caninum Liverpool]|uniref:Transmembrane protein n=1 Tax=Neospora caninum (strain Liverpool) TaxID=572307 RepID=F0VMN0_NEOCL|nr:conserved hypothetical protein [Neospora caninum Liverpool]CBZ54976.1 conserved hypothetical protein [Neospora caninum Liverpool]|eukprot:XP_003885004.1 conserved hypothetical protein [Neospora caninum Liverpool]